MMTRMRMDSRLYNQFKFVKSKEVRHLKDFKE